MHYHRHNVVERVTVLRVFKGGVDVPAMLVQIVENLAQRVSQGGLWWVMYQAEIRVTERVAAGAAGAGVAVAMGSRTSAVLSTENIASR